MNRITALFAAASLTLFAACGGGGDLRSEMKSTLEDFVETLESIETAEDAKAAAPKLEKIAETMKALDDQLKALPEDEQKALQEEDEETQALTDRMGKAMMAFMDKPEVAEALGSVMEKLDK